MASSPGPSTPEATPRRTTALNRSFTLPAKMATAAKDHVPPPEIGATEGIETLYIHPNATIIKYTASTTQPKPGSLPWTSPTERTAAVGQLEIYRVPASVSFLHSGSFLHTIMPRTPCWCVDGVSKFMLRGMMGAYYRVELPGDSAEDLEEVERFKLALQKVCHYERTACPFVRAFNTDLPEETDVRKGRRRRSTGRAKKWRLEGVWRPEDWVEPEKVSEDSASGSGSLAGSDEDSDSGSAMGEGAEAASEVRQVTPTTPMRQRALAALRSVSAPQSPVLLSTPPSKLRTRVDVDGTVEVSEPVKSGSSDRGTPTLRTFQAIPTDMPPSPPDSSAGPEHIDDRQRERDDSVDERVQHTTNSEPTDVEAGAEDWSAVVPERVQEYEGLDGAPSTLLESSPLRTEGSLFEDTPARALEIEEPSVSVVTDEPEVSNAAAFASTPAQIAPKDYGDNPFVSMDREDLQSEQSNSTGPQIPQALEDDSIALARPSLPKEADDEDERPPTPENPPKPEDPYAAIQARILARRSIGGTTHFLPNHKSPTRQSTSSTSSTATLASNTSALSRRSHSSHRHQAFASALAKKAYNTFLGPPAHLVAIMLRIAARFANGAFGVESMFYVESPIDSPRKVPGSYHLAGDYGEVGEEDWDEDDFGVPLRSPRRVGSRVEGLRERERRGWEGD